MKKALLLVLTAVATLANAQPDRDRRDRRDTRDAIVVDRSELVRELRDVEDLLQMVQNREHNPRQSDRIRSALAELRDLREAVQDAPRLGGPRGDRYRPSRWIVYEDSREPERPVLPPAPPPRPTIFPIADNTFQQLLAAVSREHFADNQMRIVQQAASSHHFLVGHVRQLVQRFSFSKDKLQVVAALNPRILDRENAFQLYQDFTFNSDKEQLRQILGR